MENKKSLFIRQYIGWYEWLWWECVWTKCSWWSSPELFNTVAEALQDFKEKKPLLFSECEGKYFLLNLMWVDRVQ